MIDFYCGINETAWNKHPVAPGPLACIAPVYGSTTRSRRSNSVSVPAGVQVIQDSGAFSDNWGERLTFEKALERQQRHADKYHYAGQITYRASYDLLIDEKWENGKRNKQRWTERDAWKAIDTTVGAAEYLVNHREGLSLILSAQGVSPKQYLKCVKRVVPLMDVSRDILGLGGWCITGKIPKQMLPVFQETVALVIPYAAARQVKQVHIWGVLLADALAWLLWYADQFGVKVSTDSTGPTTRPCFGNWGYADWTDKNYQRPPVETRGLERARHVQAVRDWLLGFRGSIQYQEVQQKTKPVQRLLFGMGNGGLRDTDRS